MSPSAGTNYASLRLPHTSGLGFNMTESHRLINEMTGSFKKSIRARDFKGIDRKAVAKFTDKELAIWQSEHPSDSPQFILAEHEWQRRLTVEQVRGARFAAYIGILGTIIGASITWLLTQ